MSVSIYYTAHRDRHITAYEQQNIDSIVERYSVAKQVEEFVVTGNRNDRDARPIGALVGGEGRRRGTGILVMRGVLDAEKPFVPVKVLHVEMAVAASMIENGRRKNMHPAEQNIGFRTLEQKSKTAYQIGALMGYHPRHVQRCLKLANLAPSLLDTLARDEISLEQSEVLTLADILSR